MAIRIDRSVLMAAAAYDNEVISVRFIFKGSHVCQTHRKGENGSGPGDRDVRTIAKREAPLLARVASPAWTGATRREWMCRLSRARQMRSFRSDGWTGDDPSPADGKAGPPQVSRSCSI